MERVAEPFLGVGDAEEVTAGTDLGDRVDGERVLVDDDRVEDRGDHRQQVGVEDELDERGVEPTLHPPRAVHQEVDATHDRAPQREHALVRGLGVDRVGGAHVRRAVRDVVAAGELATEHRRAHVLGRAERRGARQHVDVRREPAVDDGRAGAHDLRERHARERLGVLLGDRAGERDRCHRARQRERGHHDHLVARRELDDALQHRQVEAQR